MTAFQTASVWTLRALVVWAAIEFGAGVTDHVAEQVGALQRLDGHRAAMQRLNSQISQNETAARAAEARISTSNAPPLLIAAAPAAVSVERRAADTLRNALMQLGAQLPIVEAHVGAASGDARRIVFQARWQEGASAAPAVLHALAARYPDLRLRNVALTRSADGTEVITQAEFEGMARIETGAPP